MSTITPTRVQPVSFALAGRWCLSSAAAKAGSVSRGSVPVLGPQPGARRGDRRGGVGRIPGCWWGGHAVADPDPRGSNARVLVEQRVPATREAPGATSTRTTRSEVSRRAAEPERTDRICPARPMERPLRIRPPSRFFHALGATAQTPLRPTAGSRRRERPAQQPRRGPPTQPLRQQRAQGATSAAPSSRSSWRACASWRPRRDRQRRGPHAVARGRSDGLAAARRAPNHPRSGRAPHPRRPRQVAIRQRLSTPSRMSRTATRRGRPR
jgi:hypothetical protein